MRGRVGTDIGIKLLPVMWVFLKTHPLFMKYSNGTSTQCYAYHYPCKLVSCAFSTIPICPFLIQRIFHLLVILMNRKVDEAQ